MWNDRETYSANGVVKKQVSIRSIRVEGVLKSGQLKYAQIIRMNTFYYWLTYYGDLGIPDLPMF